MFRLMRFYSVASFIIIFVTAALLTLFFRQVTIHRIEHLAETYNLALAKTALNSIRPELVAYLGSEADDSAHRGASLQRFSDKLAADIHMLAQDNSVVAIKICNRNGQEVFSTRTGRAGLNQGGNPNFTSALNGRDSSSMIYRDTLNRYEGTTEEDNLMETYIPVRNSQTGLVLGVFEIYTDMSQLVRENNRHLLIVLIGSEFILALLYAVLIIIVRHAKNIIESQQKTIQERTSSLEILSKRLLKNEENKKQKIAIDLHEGLVQTLSAIKVNVENSSARIQAYDANAKPLEYIVPVLQSAIQEVRSIATELRPSSLDDLGLLPTVNWFCREFEEHHDGISIKRDISLQEATIPVPLKIVIYRIIESTFKNIAQGSYTDQIRLAMQQADNKIHLRISDTPVQQTLVDTFTQSGPDSDPRFRFAEIRERATLSGGTFTSTQDGAGWNTLHVSWAC